MRANLPFVCDVVRERVYISVGKLFAIKFKKPLRKMRVFRFFFNNVRKLLFIKKQFSFDGESSREDKETPV